MLTIRDLGTGYNKKQVLFNLSLDVAEGSIMALIGPNGAGKSTVLKAVCGLVPVWEGKIYHEGIEINGLSSAQNMSRGITYMPQGNRVFGALTIIENLELGGCCVTRKVLKRRIAEILDEFPMLKKHVRRAAGTLSGGEQQMVALARTLVSRPKLLMLDEPSLGLEPASTKFFFDKVRKINQKNGTTILIVEQKVREVLDFVHRVAAIRLGNVIFDGKPDELKDNADKLRELFL